MGNQSSNLVSDHCESAAAAPIVEQTADIFRLAIDCFDELFDYLPLKDLISVGSTCKRLQYFAGHFFRLNYAGIRILSTCNGLEIFENALNVTHFADFIRKIQIKSSEGLQSFLCLQSKLRRLKQIDIRNTNINPPEINHLKGILAKVEVLRLFEFNEHFCELTNCCENIKHLEILDPGYHRLVQKHPSKESLAFMATPDVLKFFPNLKKFATTPDCLLNRADAIQNAVAFGDIILDDLAILFDTYTGLTKISSLLKELHKIGFYKRLQLYFWRGFEQKYLDELATVGGINKLFFRSVRKDVRLSAVGNLEELRASNSNICLDGLVNLKRIHLVSGNLDHLITLIKQVEALEKIKINFLEDGTFFSKDTNVVDLVALNELREQLPNARTINLYVSEEVYLATKWSLGETNFQKFRLKRAEAFEWNHDFSFWW